MPLSHKSWYVSRFKKINDKNKKARERTNNKNNNKKEFHMSLDYIFYVSTPKSLNDLFQDLALRSDLVGDTWNATMIKKFPFFLQILKACLFDTWLAKSWASNFIQRLFSLSAT